MSGGVAEIFICGCGAVSPAGWGVEPLREALAKSEPLPLSELPRPGWPKGLRVRQVPPLATRPTFLTHARLRRASPISQYSVAAAIEALGTHARGMQESRLRLGVVLSVMTGCVNYSRRFYDEVLREPGSASPLVFPETVFNAPASHIAAVLGTTAINYTLVGDAGTFLQGLALAADWLLRDEVDGCLVIGAEELDWLTTQAFGLFAKEVVISAGAGALYLQREQGENVLGRLGFVSNPQPFSRDQSRAEAASRVRAEVQKWYLANAEHSSRESFCPAGKGSHTTSDSAITAPEQKRAQCLAGEPATQDLLCDGLQGVASLDKAEANAWRDWEGCRLSPKRILGEGSVAAAAWQSVSAIESLDRFGRAVVSVVGSNEQAIAAQFTRP